MQNREVHILSVCGGGIMSSALMKDKIEEVMKQASIPAKIDTVTASNVLDYISVHHADFIVASAVIPPEIGLPVIRGIALLTGLGEEECLREITDLAQKVLGGD